MSAVAGHVRSHREEFSQESRELHTEQGTWLTSTENKLVEGIKELLKKITNTDFASSQLYNQKIEGIASEILQALDFTQGEVAELKAALARIGEEVHSIKEMCERPVMATPPQYRAPAFGSPHDVTPAPNYDAQVRPRNVNLQQAPRESRLAQTAVA